MAGLKAPKRGGGNPPSKESENEATTDDAKELEAQFQTRNEDQAEEHFRAADAWRVAPVVACFRPVTAYKKPGGGIAFNSKEGWGDFPFQLPCGKCMGCRVAKQRAWAIRCVHESQMHERSCFITLTYDEQHLPSDGGLRLEHWQNFAKKFRRDVGPFRFFHCGEYGDEWKRPHYHALIFGHDFSADRARWRKTKQGEQVYRSKALEDLWTFGNSEVGGVNYTTASYVAGYCIKKLDGERADDEFRRVDTKTGEVFQVKEEYVTMSRNPGLGSSWFEKYWKDVFPRDEVVMAGKKLPVPPFYDLRMKEMNRDMMMKVKKKRYERGLDDEGERTYERMDARLECLRVKMKSKMRRLD